VLKFFWDCAAELKTKGFVEQKDKKNKLLLDVGGDFFFCSVKNVRDRSFFFSVPFNKTPTKVRRLLN
jgi:hypothetical protein